MCIIFLFFFLSFFFFFDYVFPAFSGKPTLAYASQRPWIQNATVRENILCGLSMDIDRYEHTCFCCVFFVVKTYFLKKCCQNFILLSLFHLQEKVFCGPIQNCNTKIELNFLLKTNLSQGVLKLL